MTEYKEPEKKRLQVNVELQDEEVDQFLEYKRREALRTNAAAGYKLIKERLSQADLTIVAA